jgi:hypothetical protein
MLKSPPKWLLLLILLVPCWVIGAQYDIDLPTLYQAIHSAVIGEWPRVYSSIPASVETSPGHFFVTGRYFYPPFSLVFFAPMGLMPYGILRWVWLALQTTGFFLFWRNLGEIYPELRSRRLDWVWFMVWVVAINPIHNNFQSNNIQLLLAALLFASELWSRSASRAQQIASGFLLAFAVGIKVYPLFLVPYYLIAKRNGVRLGVMAGGAFVALIPFAFFGLHDGLELYRAFYQNLTTYGRENSLITVEDICSLPSMVARWLHPVAGDLVATRVTQGLTVLISVAYFGLAWRARRACRSDLQTEFWALGLALMIFLNPSTRPHYYLFYVPAFVSLGLYVKASRATWAGAFLAISVLLVAFTAEGITGKHLNNVLEMSSVPTIGMLLLCVSLFAILARALGASLSPRRSVFDPLRT